MECGDDMSPAVGGPETNFAVEVLSGCSTEIETDVDVATAASETKCNVRKGDAQLTGMSARKTTAKCPNVCPFRQTFFDKLPAPVDELGATFHLHKIWLGPMPLPILFHPLFLMHNRIMNNARELHLLRFGGVSGKSQSGWPAIPCPKGPNHVL